MQHTSPRPTLWQQAMSAGLINWQWQLAQLDWSHPLTRTAMRDQWAALPDEIYLRLPASKSFTSAGTVVRFLFQREADDLPEDWLVTSHGGPPSWGRDPLVAGPSHIGGSATDTTMRR